MSQSDETKIEILRVQMDALDKKVDGVIAGQEKMNDKLDTFIEKMQANYVKNSDFNFWRNTLIGLVITVMGAIIIMIIAKVFNLPTVN